jgi:hypothetical protein
MKQDIIELTAYMAKIIMIFGTVFAFLIMIH